MKLSSLAALALGLALAEVPVTAQELPIRTTLLEDRPVLLLPSGALERSGVASFAGVDVEVSTDRNLRTYRATYRGRTYTAYADVSGPPTRLAFDPAQRRFRVVTSTIRVELANYDDLERLRLDAGAISAKAYPELGFALIRLDRRTDPAEVADRLAVDPRVRRASLLFERPVRRPMLVPGTRIHRSRPRRAAPGGAHAKASSLSDLAVSARVRIEPAGVRIEVAVENFSDRPFEPDAAAVLTMLLAPVANASTPDPNDFTVSPINVESERVPALDPWGAPYIFQKPFSTESLDAGETYYVGVYIVAADIDEAIAVADLSDEEFRAGIQTGFTLDGVNRVQQVCVESGRGSVDGVPDPLRPRQWHLHNTGQSAFAQRPGVAGEDLRMAGVLSDGPTGRGVTVAVVDTGMEICHPDLKAGVEAGASFNFNASLAEPGASPSWTPGADPFDPFNFDPKGDHGTGVAGLIAAAANNATGGRGVAPGVSLRGYNMLAVLDRDNTLRALLDSLGASAYEPDSSDVDVFNMSIGDIATPRLFALNASVDEELLFSHGVRHLRSGLGALYVKAAGNEFDDCGIFDVLDFPVQAQIGCYSSDADPWHNLPYLIVVGAFNAHGQKSSYSSAGSNLWISAPGGEYGDLEAALLSTDQMGWKRGYGVLQDDPLDEEWTVNPHGDYTGLMNGTSAATPNVSGGIAVLLEQAPRLTWRDVKHILATTARRIDPDIEAVEEPFGGNARTLRLPWAVNSAGYAFHNWYGFGALDLDAALELARRYTPDSLGAFRQSGWFDSTAPLAIPDHDGTGATQPLQVGGLRRDAHIEAVVVELHTDHAAPYELGIHLVSPHGTRSVLNQVFNTSLEGFQDTGLPGWRLLSNAFYGENPNGDWRIDVFDAAEGDTGDLKAWRLRFYYGNHPDPQ